MVDAISHEMTSGGIHGNLEIIGQKAGGICDPELKFTIFSIIAANCGCLHIQFSGVMFLCPHVAIWSVEICSWTSEFSTQLPIQRKWQGKYCSGSLGGLHR